MVKAYYPRWGYFCCLCSIYGSEFVLWGLLTLCLHSVCALRLLGTQGEGLGCELLNQMKIKNYMYTINL